MKKNLFNTISLALFTVFLFVSCQKEIKESPAINTSKDGAVTLETANKEEKNSCRLVSLDWSAGGAGLWQFHYNEKGLAELQEANFNIFEKVQHIVQNQAGYYGMPRHEAIQATERALKEVDLWDKRNAQADCGCAGWQAGLSEFIRS